MKSLGSKNVLFVYHIAIFSFGVSILIRCNVHIKYDCNIYIDGYIHIYLGVLYSYVNKYIPKPVVSFCFLGKHTILSQAFFPFFNTIPFRESRLYWQSMSEWCNLF